MNPPEDDLPPAALNRAVDPAVAAVSRRQVALFIAARIALNGAYRVVYPFLGSFASGMGVSLQAAAYPLTVRALIGGFSPLLGPVADRYGRKVGMLLGLGMFVCGAGLVALWPSFPAFFAALILTALGNQMFVPAMQAYLGDRVAYRRRGAVLALTEMGWSLSFIVLVPLLGLLIARLGWTAPFWLLAGLGAAAFAAIVVLVPRDAPHPRERENAIWHGLRQVISSRVALTALGFYLLIVMGNEVVNVMFGVWLRQSFSLQVTALGLVAFVIGMSELSGESATALLVDRVGKKRAVRLGVGFTCLAALALPWLGRTQAGAVVGLFLFYLGFEFSLVSFIPLLTEALPSARATLMAGSVAASSLGRALGALIGPGLFQFGFEANAWVCLAVNVLALVVLSRVRIDE